MSNIAREQMDRLVARLEQAPGLADQLPAPEGDIVRSALEGQSVYEIAQTHQMNEAAVWNVLNNAARSATGQKVEPVESSGLGSDTDPDSHGGYGKTGFGSLGNEPPMPDPEEPDQPYR